jgi:hypothetical protein
LKKPTGSVRFQFYKLRTEKTEPKQKKQEKKPSQIRKKNRAKPKKPSQTKKIEPNQFEPVFVLKNLTETGWFEPVSVQFRFFLKKSI